MFNRLLMTQQANKTKLDTLGKQIIATRDQVVAKSQNDKEKLETLEQAIKARDKTDQLQMKLQSLPSYEAMLT